MVHRYRVGSILSESHSGQEPEAAGLVASALRKHKEMFSLSVHSLRLFDCYVGLSHLSKPNPENPSQTHTPELCLLGDRKPHQSRQG